jgi:Lon-like protease
MNDSQLTAKAVALETLGYEVPRTGKGAQVVAVDPESPAAGTLEVGDVITAIDGTPVTLSEEIGPLVRDRTPGEPVTMTVTRGDEERTVTVDTRAAADGEFEGQAQVGIATQTLDLQYDFPVDITIDTGKVGGPSAGLAFTLTIIDEMTPGSLTAGANIAVTGTIQPDASVGEIGGIEQKAAAAQDAGATLFIVPAAEAGEARRYAGDMDVVGVENLDDALAALEAAGGAPVEPVPDAA